MTPRIIAVCGGAGHGKDVIGMILNSIGYRQMAFADALKSDVLKLDPYVGITPKGMVRLSTVVNHYGWSEAKKNPEVRRLLQHYGTEVCRNNFGENVWVDRLNAAITPSMRKIVITDLRFFNEARWAHDVMGGEIWRVIRPSSDMPMTKEAQRHQSEVESSAIHADIIIDNSGTLDDLKRTVLAFGNRPASENRCDHDIHS